MLGYFPLIWGDVDPLILGKTTTMGPPSARTLWQRTTTFFQDFLNRQPLGDIWEGPEAAKAHQDGRLCSQAGGKSLRVAFRNLSTMPLVLCWVSEKGDLHHFYKLSPSTRHDMVSVTEGDHVEHTCGGHAFCLAMVPEDQMDETKRSKRLPDTASIIAGYRPFQDCDDERVHLVTVSRGQDLEGVCCGVPGLNLRKRKAPPFETSEHSSEWCVKASLAEIDPTPWDTTRKVYVLQMLGGWPVYAEPNWFKGDQDLEKQLACDLEAAAKILPPHAVDYLQANCPIWVNSSIKFGPKACPHRGRGCCYHPDKEWLIENGMNDLKHKCVEINNGPGYKKDLHCWGPGGVMVHELCHAYHHRMLPDGYKNKEILACYEAAMKERLYECVKVHGPQGPEAKAYACSNDKEYFAELSTAFLGGAEEGNEYNKWFPFNRKQLKAHDPRAYALLCRLWKVDPK